MYFKNVLLILLMCFVLSACSFVQMKEVSDTKKQLFGTIHQDYVAREFRAAWVATVANINWPKEPGLTVEEQKNKLFRFLIHFKNITLIRLFFRFDHKPIVCIKALMNLGRITLLVSKVKAPEPFYDPLKFWIKQAHKRGLKLHAWINPYRAHHH